MVVDTGATRSCVGDALARRLHTFIKEVPTTYLAVGSGERLRIKEVSNVELQLRKLNLRSKEAFGFLVVAGQPVDALLASMS